MDTDSFKFTIHTDHNEKRTIMRRYEFGKLMDEKTYNQSEHYSLLVSIIEAFRGKGCCDQGEYKGAKIPPGYWNSPLGDPYEVRA